MLPISVVILSHNRFTDLSRNLSLIISDMHYPDELEIIIVDNNSNDGTKEYLKNLSIMHPGIILVLNEANLGVAGGRNSGFQRVSREFILSLDDDTTISPADIRQIPRLFSLHEDAGILAFRVIHMETRQDQNPNGNEICDIANHHGAAFALRTSMIRTIGGIDNECDFGAEELDLAIKAHSNGWKIMYFPFLIAYHNNYKRDTDLAQYRRIRRVYNNVRIYFKYFPTWMAFRNGLRYTISANLSWFAEYKKFFGGFKLFYAFIQGSRIGLKQHISLPETTINYYNDPNLRPEFGNVSLIKKVFYKMIRK